MKPDPEFDAARDNAYRVTAGELRAFIERIEALDAETATLRAARREALAEAKGRGYDAKAIARLVAERRSEPDKLAEAQAVLDLYREVLGMGT